MCHHLLSAALLAERCNFQSFGKTLILRIFASFVCRRDLANGEILDNKSRSSGGRRPQYMNRCCLAGVKRTVPVARADGRLYV
jgi:hypothetical protein